MVKTVSVQLDAHLTVKSEPESITLILEIEKLPPFVQAAIVQHGQKLATPMLAAIFTNLDGIGAEQIGEGTVEKVYDSRSLN